MSIGNLRQSSVKKVLDVYKRRWTLSLVYSVRNRFMFSNRGN
jgi:hypothetical protein